MNCTRCSALRMFVVKERVTNEAPTRSTAFSWRENIVSQFRQSHPTTLAYSTTIAQDSIEVSNSRRFICRQRYFKHITVFNNYVVTFNIFTWRVAIQLHSQRDSNIIGLWVKANSSRVYHRRQRILSYCIDICITSERLYFTILLEKCERKTISNQ